ncbi:PXA domain containing protein [Pyrenophora teres f. teres]|uniref:PXA domain containing protein n=1 Tax=Pyrenophora teres f. teres TaxID=97479 RepID=A0A6S6VHU8_9PLEO|nr:PXA domain containing protein [Pyrenophora teres f. teres]
MLPPLTSSNEVDLQLYGIISVIIKEFVQTWYTKITPDQVFVNEVIQIIAHCTRGLEQRLRKVDLEALLLDEIPELLQAHLCSFRLAMQQAASSTSLASDPRTIYHALHPHPALSPVPTDLVPSTVFEQRESESAWRQLLVHGVLALSLPTEDLENGCLRTLVAEIFAEMILGNGISGKACEGWVLWEGITRIAEVLQTDAPKEMDSQSEGASAEQSLTRLERYGLLPHEGSDVRSKEQLDIGQPCHQTTTGYTSGLFWTVVQYAFLAFTAARAVIFSVATSSSLPSRSTISEQSSVEMSGQSKMPHADATASRRPLGAKRPVVNMALWSCAAQFAELDVRMPWLLGFISMLHHGALVGPGRVGDTDGVLDRVLRSLSRLITIPASLDGSLTRRLICLHPSVHLGTGRTKGQTDGASLLGLAQSSGLQLHCGHLVLLLTIATSMRSSGSARRSLFDQFLSHTIHTKILNPAFLPVALRTLRATLFPSNTLGPPREMPTDEEAKVIKHRCAATLLDLVPSKVAAGFFASSEREDQIRQIEDTLSCLDDTYLNKHFVFQVVELIVLRLFPELGDQGVKDLLEERIS